MYFREFTLRADLSEQIATEILFELASARVDGIEVLCINIFNEEKEYSLPEKHQSTVVKTLKKLKENGKIQLFATGDSFKLQKTEAFFLQNKYPDLFDSSLVYCLGENKIYIKI